MGQFSELVEQKISEGGDLGMLLREIDQARRECTKAWSSTRRDFGLEEGRVFAQRLLVTWMAARQKDELLTHSEVAGMSDRDILEIEFLGLCENKAVRDEDMQVVMDILAANMPTMFGRGLVTYVRHKRAGQRFWDWWQGTVDSMQMGESAWWPEARLALFDAYLERDERTVEDIAEVINKLNLYSQGSIYVREWVSVEQCREWLKSHRVDQGSAGPAGFILGLPSLTDRETYHWNALAWICEHDMARAIAIVDTTILATMMRANIDHTLIPLARRVLSDMAEMDVVRALEMVGSDIWATTSWRCLIMEMFPELRNRIKAQVLASAGADMRVAIMGNLTRRDGVGGGPSIR